MKNSKAITRVQALEMFEDFKKITASGVTFSNITYLVDVNESKTVNKQKLLKKLVQVNITLGASYADKVNRILKAQGDDADFVAKAMTGKEYYIDGNNVLARDTATLKKRYLVLDVENHTNVSARQLYIADGMKPVTKEEVWNEQYLTTSGLNPTTYTAGRGAVSEEKNFFFRTLGFQNIISFKVGGVLHTIID
jgi:hypothetical protein